MVKCLKHFGRDCVIFLTTTVGVFLVVFLYTTWKESSYSIDTSLWLQSAERRLEDQNERYYNELYDRYSRVHRDLNDYQYLTNQRLESLEGRLRNIENSIERQNISINQTQISGDNNAK